MGQETGQAPTARKIEENEYYEVDGLRKRIPWIHGKWARRVKGAVLPRKWDKNEPRGHVPSMHHVT